MPQPCWLLSGASFALGPVIARLLAWSLDSAGDPIWVVLLLDPLERVAPDA